MPKTARFTVESLVDESSKGDFHTKLGAFIDTFSSVEGQLLFVVHHYGKLRWDMAKAILSPLRVENAITTLNRIIETRRLRGKRIAELKAILVQLAAINKTRNDILHNGFWSGSKTFKGRYVVTNELYARSPQTVFKFRISETELLQMRGDLVDIWLRLFSGHMKIDARKSRPKFRVFRRDNPIGVAPTWRYTPPERATNHPKRRLPDLKRQRPQKPSAA